MEAEYVQEYILFFV